MRHLENCKCTLFPIDPDSYAKLKFALKTFGGIARIYDRGGVLIEDERRYKGVSPLDPNTSKESNSRNGDSDKRP